MFAIRRRLPALFAVALLVLAAGVGTACGGDDDSSGSARDLGVAELGKSPFRGAYVDPPFDKPAIVMTDTAGNQFDLLKQTEGYVTLLYVGYTHCPDICPTHMHDIAAVLTEADAAVAAKTKLVFVTADPERDTPQQLQEWLHFFNPGFIGLVPTSDQLNSLLDSLGMPRTEYTDIGSGNYSVSHAAYVIAFTPDNLGHLVYPFGVTIEDWRHDLSKLALVGWNEK
jgi:protein SCO1/2